MKRRLVSSSTVSSRSSISFPRAVRVPLIGSIAPATASRVPTVVLVDEDARFRALFCAALEGIALVLEASDGDEALTILEQRAGCRLDLMLVDHVIPKRSGLELLRLTKERWPWFPVVVITGYGSEDLAVQAFRAGASDYLRKPIDMRELRRVILTHARAGCSPADRQPPRKHPDPHVSADAGVTHLGICRALAFIRNDFTGPITLAQAAREAGLSKFHFCRLFQRQVGFSFREYLHGLRIERAKLLLTDPRKTVAEVAYGTGFNDLSHFDRIFKRIIGISPTAYRRNIRPA